MSDHTTAAPRTARKGDTVVTTREVLAVYTMTEAELAAWYEDQVGYDAHGESHVCTGNYRVKVPAGTQFTVVRARCTAEVGWNTFGGFTEVIDPTTGVVLKIQRKDLRAA